MVAFPDGVLFFFVEYRNRLFEKEEPRPSSCIVVQATILIDGISHPDATFASSRGDSLMWRKPR